MEIFLLFATSGSGWQSLRRPWQFPRRESSFPSSTQVPPTASSYHSGSLGFWVLALVLQKWSSVLQALSFLLLHLPITSPNFFSPFREGRPVKNMTLITKTSLQFTSKLFTCTVLNSSKAQDPSNLCLIHLRSSKVISTNFCQYYYFLNVHNI